MPDKGTFSQANNGQLSVETATMFITGNYLTQATNDKQQLIEALSHIDMRLGTPTAALADARYFSMDKIASSPVEAYISARKARHERTAQ